MKYLSFLFATFLAAATPVQSAERAFNARLLCRPVPLGLIGGAFLCGTATGFIYEIRKEQAHKKSELSRLCEPYAWTHMHVKTADGAKSLEWHHLCTDIKNDQKVAQAVAKNQYSDAELWTAFEDAKKRIKARDDAKKAARVGYEEDTVYTLENDPEVPRWVQISNLWHKHKRESSPTSTRTEFNNLVLEANLPELLAPAAEKLLHNQNEENESPDTWNKRHIRAGLTRIGFNDVQDEHINAIYDADEKKRPNNVWQKALAFASAGKLDAQKSVEYAGVPKTHTPKFEKRNPEEVFVEHTKLPWYIYYPLSLLPFLNEKIALKRRAPWFWTKEAQLEREEARAKDRSGTTILDSNADEQSGALPQDVLSTEFWKSYEDKLDAFNSNKNCIFIAHIISAVQRSPVANREAHDPNGAMRKDFRICVNNFCIALDSYNKLIKDQNSCDRTKNIWIDVGHYFEDYLKHRHNVDYGNWETKKHLISSSREYHLKALYNAHEDLALAGKNLVDFWVQNSEKVLSTSDAGSQKRSSEMRDALRKHGVAELVLQHVFEVKNEKL